MRRGEVWWADLHEPWGRRPVLLVARDDSYRLLTWVMIAPLTSRLRDVPSTVLLDPVHDGVPEPSVVLLDSIRAIRREWLDSPITTLDPVTMRAADRAIEFAFGLHR
jgi:mRNA interferase MazF